jgi:hypothetical protein
VPPAPKVPTRGAGVAGPVGRHKRIGRPSLPFSSAPFLTLSGVSDEVAILDPVDTTGRDQGLRRLSRITRWSVAGAVVVTGMVSAMVAHARPGHVKTTTAAPSPMTSTGSGFLQPPSQAPSRGFGGGIVTSGAT